MVYWADLIIFFLSYLIPSARFLITLWIHWTYVYRRSRTNWYILYCSDCLDLIRAIIHYSAIKCPFEYVRTAMITSSYRKWWTFSNDSSEAQNEQKRRTKKKNNHCPSGKRKTEKIQKRSVPDTSWDIMAVYRSIISRYNNIFVHELIHLCDVFYV